MSYSVKAIIRLEKMSKKTGEVPVCVRTIKDRQNLYETIFKIKPEFWDLKNCKVKKTHPNADEMNSFLQKRIAKTNSDILMVNLTTDEIGVNSIRTKMKKSSSIDFFKYADDYIQGLSKISTKNRYRSIIAKFKIFIGKETLPINSINIKVINDYENYSRVKFKNRPNTIASNMKILKKFVTDIYRVNKLEYVNNPFLDYKLKSEKTKREKLNEQEISRIVSLKITPVNPLYDAKQIFIFSCHTGLRVSDSLTLRWENIYDDKLSFTMRKTNEPIEIPLSDFVKHMISIKAGNSYLGKSQEQSN